MNKVTKVTGGGGRKRSRKMNKVTKVTGGGGWKRRGKMDRVTKVTSRGARTPSDTASRESGHRATSALAATVFEMRNHRTHVVP
jgi:hypothetical protein